jgi:hypothetical protein
MLPKVMSGASAGSIFAAVACRSRTRAAKLIFSHSRDDAGLQQFIDEYYTREWGLYYDPKQPETVASQLRRSTRGKGQDSPHTAGC